MERSVLFVPVDRVIWHKRIFDFKKNVVAEIKQSMKEVGQLQPIVVVPPHDRVLDGVIIPATSCPTTLKIGRHRYQAVKELYAEDPEYVHYFLGQPVPRGTIPALDLTDIPPEMLLNMEIHENVYRMDLSWQEKAAALAQLHEIEKEKHEAKKLAGEIPASAAYTISQTAKKLAGATGGNEHAIINKVSQSLILAKQLEDPDVAKADSAKSAFNVIKNKLTAQARLLASDHEGETPHELIVGDCTDIMDDWVQERVEGAGEMETPELFDLILADPPYGIGADTYDNMREHKYDDSWENAEAIYGAIAGLGYTLTKERANLFLFCTPERWHCVRDIAEKAGWVSWPRPIIWLKSNEGMRPWGQQGLAYTYECIYFGTKGQKGLIATANDVFQFYKPKSSEREHAAAKPVELYARLMELTCLPGDRVLDPCVGSGTSFKAGILRNLKVTGIENNEETAKIAQKNLFWDGKSDLGPRVEPAPVLVRGLADL